MEEKELHAVRRHVGKLLSMEGAHLSFAEAVADFPREMRGAKPLGVPHSAWELLEHLRLAQADILDFSRTSEYAEKRFPDDYWPSTAEPPSDAAWDESVRGFERDLKEMQALVADPANDLLAKIPHGEGQTLLREALLVADHSSYHLGQLMFLRKMLENHADSVLEVLS